MLVKVRCQGIGCCSSFDGDKAVWQSNVCSDEDIVVTKSPEGKVSHKGGSTSSYR